MRQQFACIKFIDLYASAAISNEVHEIPPFPK
jgi:hypothetical protein